MKTRWATIPCVLAFMSTACGGQSEDDGGGASGTGGAGGQGGTGGTAAAAGAAGAAGSSGTGGSAGSAGMGGGGGAAGAAGFSCPDSPPASGTSCTPPPPSANVAHCSWGDDPRPSCRTMARCGPNETWEVTEPDSPACSDSPLPAECPAPPPSEGTECSEVGRACWYDDGTHCWCSDCAGGSGYPTCKHVDPPQWACWSPPAGCPTIVPQAGEACDQEGLSCGPRCELPIVCEDGFWQWRQNNCPICAAPDTPIATPTGERAIAELREGDLVYSVEDGAVVAVPILRAGKTRVSAHRVVRVTFNDGRAIEMSPGHPTADGRTVADLEAGDALDGYAIAHSETVEYDQNHTYDILPATRTGVYFAAGVRIGSTLGTTHDGLER